MKNRYPINRRIDRTVHFFKACTTMLSQVLVRQGFLWGLAAIYLFAFASLYIQIPGLYGDKGLLPASYVLRQLSACMDKDPKCVEWSLKGECDKNLNWMSTNCKKSCNKCQDYSLISLFKSKPTLLWFTPVLGLDTTSGMEFLCLVGIVLCIVLLVSQRCRDCVNFLVLWLLYFSLIQVGQIFLWYQWDGLLLETGFIAVFIAPWNIKLLPWKWKLYKCKRIRNMIRHHDTVTLWLIKWLLFRLMFASGVVKLSYMDPTWWSLTAMYWHYESQCIPTPIAWYLHKLPKWFHRLSTIFTYVIEIGLPFLFFVPVRSLRLFAYCGQVLLQLLIMSTGNYNFFNLLTIVLCISLLDDKMITSQSTCSSLCRGMCCRKKKAKCGEPKHSEKVVGDIVIDCPPTGDQDNVEEKPSADTKSNKEPSPTSTNEKLLELIMDYVSTRYHGNALKRFREFLHSKTARILQTCVRVTMFVCGIVVMVFLVKRWFYFEVDDGKLMSWIAFSPQDFRTFVAKTTIAAMWIGFFSLLVEVFGSYTRILLETSTKVQKNSSLIQCTAMTLVTLWLFAVSLDPLTDVSRQAKSSLPVVIRKWYQDTKSLEIAHPYGLFRSMTGVGGRPEIVILGSNVTTGPWKEYNFRYKPGNIYQPPPFVAPHQPRLDWQMWFAALESFDSNPWFHRLLYKLLQGDKDVLRLMGENNEFTNSPPRYIRTQLYLYHYTENTTSLTDVMFHSSSNRKAWWTREYIKDYTPFILSNQSTSLLQRILHQEGLYKENFKENNTGGFIHSFVLYLRRGYKHTEPQNFISLLFFIVVTLLVFKVWWRKLGKTFCTPKLIRVKEKCEPPLKQASDSISRCKAILSQRCTAVTYRSPIGRLLRAQCLADFCERLCTVYRGVCLMVNDHWNRGCDVIKTRVKSLGPSSKKKE